MSKYVRPRFTFQGLLGAVLENFQRLDEFFQRNTNLFGFKHFEITLVTDNGNDPQLIPHGLDYQPKDVVVTSLTGGGLVQFNYGDFTKDDLSVTVIAGTVTEDSPTIIRFYLGTHKEATFT